MPKKESMMPDCFRKSICEYRTRFTEVYLSARNLTANNPAIYVGIQSWYLASPPPLGT